MTQRRPTREDSGTVLPEDRLELEDLKRRARDLARLRELDIDLGEILSVLTFTTGVETFAIEVRFARKVVQLNQITPVPCTPPFVNGIINVRGQIISVLDLHVFLGLPARGIVDRGEALILEHASMDFGVLIQNTLGIDELAVTDIQPSIRGFEGASHPCVRGITEKGVVVLDGQRLLDDPEIVVHEVI